MAADGPVAVERCLSLLALLLNERLTTRQIAEALPASYAGLTESENTGRARDLFDKDRKLLERMGYEVRSETVAREGGVITLYWVDAATSPAAVRFTASQTIALTRLLQYVWLGRAVHDELADAVDAEAEPDDATIRISAPLTLASVWRAQLDGRQLQFSFAGRPRKLVSVVVTYDDEWLVSGWDLDRDDFRTFPLLALEDVRVGAPQGPVRHRRGAVGTSPLDWPVDPPCTAELSIGDGHLADALDGLRSPQREPKVLRGTLQVEVVHRDAFLRAVLQLGPHAVLLGPDDLRDQLIDRLRTWQAQRGVA